MSFIIYTGRIGWCVKRKLIGRFRIRGSKIWIDKRIFDKNKEKVQQRKWEVSQSGWT